MCSDHTTSAGTTLQLKNTSSNTSLYKRRNHFASPGCFVHLSNAKSFLFSTPRGITTPSLKTPKTGGGRWGGCMREKNAGVVVLGPISFSFLFLMIALTNTLFLMFFIQIPFLLFFPLPPSSPSNHTSLPLVFLHVLTIFIINKRLCVCVWVRVCECVCVSACVSLLENTPHPPHPSLSRKANKHNNNLVMAIIHG